MFRGRFFKRLILSFLIVFVVPYIVLGYLLYAAERDDYHEKNQLALEQSLIAAARRWEGALEDLEELTYLLSHSFPTDVTDILQVRSILSQLQSYQRLNDLLYDIAVFLDDSDWVITSQTLMSSRLFTEAFYRYEYWPRRSLLETVRSVRDVAIRPQEPIRLFGDDREEFVTVIHSLDSARRSKVGAVLYLIRAGDLEAVFGSAEGGARIVTIHGDAERVLYSSGDLDIASLYDASKDQIPQRDLLDRTHYVAELRVMQTGTSYAAVVARDEFGSGLTQTYVRLSIVYGALLGAGLLVSVLLFRRSYRPFRHLAEHVSHVTGATEQMDMDSIQREFDSLVAERARLRERLEQHTYAATQHFIASLLHGSFTSIEEANEWCPDPRYRLAYRRFACLAIGFGSATPPVDLRRTIEAWNDRAPSVQTYLRSDARETIVLLCLRDESALSDQLLDGLSRGLAEATIGVGRPTDSVADLDRIVEQAREALAYRFVAGPRAVIRFEETIPNGLYDLPDREIQTVHDSVRTGASEEAREALTSITAVLADRRPPLPLVRRLAHLLAASAAQAINDVASDAGHVNATAEGAGVRAPRLLEVAAALQTGVEFETIHDVVALIQEAAERIHVAAMHQRGPEIRVHAAKEIVSRELANPDLSPVRVSEELGVSSQYLSGIFSDVTNGTLQEYIRERRNERAKELLSGTDLPIKAVMVDVGYLNVSSFIRQFHRSEGVTPGEFRRTHRLGPR